VSVIRPAMISELWLDIDQNSEIIRES